jgi:hypothetical protein
MSNPPGQGVPDGVVPIYWTDWADEVVILEGPLRIARSGTTHDVDGYVAMRWQPSPGLYMHVWSQVPGGIPEALDVALPEPLPELVPDVAIEVPLPPTEVVKAPPPTHGSARITLGRYDVGPAGPLTSVVFDLINFDAVLGSSAYVDRTGGWNRRRLHLAAGPWQCIIDGRADAADALQFLRESGAFAFTHVGEMTRVDGAVLVVDDLKELLEDLWLFLSFARAALVGIALPVGVDASGTRVWAVRGLALSFMIASPSRCPTGLGSPDTAR